jgi:hypothetical protein
MSALKLDAETKSEVQRLLQPSNLQGTLAVATSWGMIAACFVLAGLWSNPLTILLALILLGGRQLALAILARGKSSLPL